MGFCYIFYHSYKLYVHFLQCLTRTQEKKKRKFPPSSKEIECVTARKPINEKVFFLNGDHRVIEFDAAATCGEVMDMWHFVDFLPYFRFFYKMIRQRKSCCLIYYFMTIVTFNFKIKSLTRIYFCFRCISDIYQICCQKLKFAEKCLDIYH